VQRISAPALDSELEKSIPDLAVDYQDNCLFTKIMMYYACKNYFQFMNLPLSYN
jgi:hypothetical protein